MGVKPKHPEEDGAAMVPDQGREAVVIQHAMDHHPEQGRLIALPEEEARTDPGPIEDEAGEPKDERADASGPVDIHVGMDITCIIVPAVVNLVMSSTVRIGDRAIKGPNNGRINVIGKKTAHIAGQGLAFTGGKEGPRIAIKSMFRVPLLMNERFMMGKEAIPWTETAQMINEKGGNFKAERRVSIVHPIEESRDDE